MIDVSDIESMDEEDVATFAREVESVEQLEECVRFSQQLRAYALRERKCREQA